MAWRYLRAAFNARPLGMPIPPNWFGLAAFALLGAFLDPGFFLIGAGLELGYLGFLARNPRFRALVDGAARAGEGEDARAGAERHRLLLLRLEPADRARQAALEGQAAEIADGLGALPGGEVHADALARLCWSHLRLLVARAALARVVASGAADARALDEEEARLRRRLAAAEVPADLRATLEAQAEVIAARRAGHREAALRRERADAELARIGQQVALLREQALLATDEAEVARSVDALAASLGEANRWMVEDRELLGDLDDAASPPPDLLRRAQAARPPPLSTGDPR